MADTKGDRFDTETDIHKHNDMHTNADAKTNAFTGISSGRTQHSSSTTSSSRPKQASAQLSESTTTNPGTQQAETQEDTTSRTTPPSLSSSTRTPHPNANTLKSQLWYKPELTHIHPVIRRLLSTHATTRSQIKSHIEAVRDEAWEVFPYPVIGAFHFAEPTYSEHPLYESGIMEPLKQDDEARLLDVGCGFATDFRILASSGVSLTESKVVGLDREMGFVDLSYKLFGDSPSTLGARFVTADILKPESIPEDLWGRFDIIWGGASFHLFGWEDQVEAYVTAVKMLKTGPGSVRVLGYSAAHKPGVERFGMYWHDPGTFVKLWGEVVKRLGNGAGRWRVRSWMDSTGMGDMRKSMGEEGLYRQLWAAERLERVEGKDEGEGVVEAKTDDAGRAWWDEELRERGWEEDDDD